MKTLDNWKDEMENGATSGRAPFVPLLSGGMGGGKIGHNSAHLHPADELADVRSKIATLKVREAELRERILETGDFSGEAYRAWVQETERDQWDHKALKEEFGMAALRPFVRKAKMVAVRLKGNFDDR